VDEFREREQMIASFTANELPDVIPSQIGIALYRIAQEALRNVSKHAGKTHVRVVLRTLKNILQLQILDSGEGFDPAEYKSGLGVISMEERARQVGGSVQIDAALGEGTRVTVSVPLPAV